MQNTGNDQYGKKLKILEINFFDFSIMDIQYNLAIVDTQGTFSKCPLYGGVHFGEVFDFFAPN